MHRFFSFAGLEVDRMEYLRMTKITSGDDFYQTLVWRRIVIKRKEFTPRL